MPVPSARLANHDGADVARRKKSARRAGGERERLRRGAALRRSRLRRRLRRRARKARLVLDRSALRSSPDATTSVVAPCPSSARTEPRPGAGPSARGPARWPAARASRRRGTAGAPLLAVSRATLARRRAAAVFHGARRRNGCSPRRSAREARVRLSSSLAEAATRRARASRSLWRRGAGDFERSAGGCGSTGPARRETRQRGSVSSRSRTFRGRVEEPSIATEASVRVLCGPPPRPRRDRTTLLVESVSPRRRDRKRDAPEPLSAAPVPRAAHSLPGTPELAPTPPHASAAEVRDAPSRRARVFPRDGHQRRRPTLHRARASTRRLEASAASEVRHRRRRRAGVDRVGRRETLSGFCAAARRSKSPLPRAPGGTAARRRPSRRRGSAVVRTSAPKTGAGLECRRVVEFVEFASSSSSRRVTAAVPMRVLVRRRLGEASNAIVKKLSPRTRSVAVETRRVGARRRPRGGWSPI